MRTESEKRCCTRTTPLAKPTLAKWRGLRAMKEVAASAAYDEAVPVIGENWIESEAEDDARKRVTEDDREWTAEREREEAEPKEFENASNRADERREQADATERRKEVHRW